MSRITPAAVRLHTPAKLNLLLRILERDTDGFHALETLFVKLELADVVTVRLHEHERTLTVSGPSVPANGLGPVHHNLAWRAAEAYVTRAGWPTGFALDIEKHIPVGGGLGGGSADAAAVLRALDVLNPAPLGADALLEIGATLGADVPFLVSDALLAWGWSRGDHILALPPLPPAAVTLVTFAEGVHTGEAYRTLAARRASAPARARGRGYPADAFGSWASVAARAHNDFETVVPAMHAGVARWLPRVVAAARELAAHGPAVGRMSGSGATCFVLHAGATPIRLAGATDELGASGEPGVQLLTTRTAARIVAPERIV